jgi:hypothetical protein
MSAYLHDLKINFFGKKEKQKKKASRHRGVDMPSRFSEKIFPPSLFKL